MKTEQFAQARLLELGCEKLPRHVREAVEIEFSRTVEDSLKRLARRHITIPKVAKAFLASVDEKQGGGRRFAHTARAV